MVDTRIDWPDMPVIPEPLRTHWDHRAFPYWVGVRGIVDFHGAKGHNWFDPIVACESTNASRVTGVREDK